MAAPNMLTWAQSLMSMPTYSARIPQSVRENITRLGYYINSDDFDPTALTPFINGMLAKVGKQLITGFQWDDDKFNTFYKGEIPVGGFIENNFIGIQAAEKYPVDLTEGQTVDPFIIRKPQVKTTYFAVNFGMQYITSISDEQVSISVLSNETLSNFIMEAVGVLARSMQLDKYLVVREMFGAGDIYGYTDSLPITSTGDSFTEAEAIEIVKRVSSVSTAMGYAQAKYTKAQVVNGLRKSDRVLIINGTVLKMLRSALRKTFNDEIDFDVDEVIEVDGFGESGASAGMYACIVSREGVKLYDKQKQRTDNIYNPRGDYWNHFCKGWGFVGYANTAPAAKFVLTAAAG